MVLLGCTLDAFSERDWQRAFQAYVKANGSHWTGPPFETVKRLLEKNGAYEFGFTAMGTWASKFRLAVREDGEIEALFIRNADLGKRMQASLDTMERKLLDSLRKF